MANPNAGWYDDGSGQMRWWDGKSWTAHTAVDTPVGSDPAQVTTVTAGAPPAAVRRRVWPWFLGGGILLLLVLAGGAVLLVLSLTGVLGGAGSPADSVTQFDKAWQTSDCGLVQSVTTTAYQKDLGFDDCATFSTAAKSLSDSTNDYLVTVTSVSITNSEATVKTVESYVDVESGDKGSTSYTYDLQKENGKWLIAGVSSTG